MKKMLLVEDHNLLRFAFLRQLRHYDVEVTEASSYAEALRHLMDGTIEWDIILSDYDLSLTAEGNLAACTGLMLLEVAPAGTQRILISGVPVGLIEKEEERLKAATDTVLEKPFVMSEVADKLGLERRVDDGQ